MESEAHKDKEETEEMRVLLDILESANVIKYSNTCCIIVCNLSGV